MRLAVLGAGMMGRAAVHDLARTPGVDEVLVLDLDAERASGVARIHGAGKARGVCLDLSDQEQLAAHLDGCQAALGAASYKLNVVASRACIAARCHYCDLGGNNDVVRQQFAMGEEAAEAGVALVPDCGLAPGMVSVLTARILEILPGTHSVRIRVGGLPREPVPPFNYELVFSMEGLVNEYREPALVLEEGEVREVPSLDGLETVPWPPGVLPVRELEAFNTSGGSSTLPLTYRHRLRSLDYKTLRYRGHRDLVAALMELGLADDEPRPGVAIRPGPTLKALLEPAIAPRGPDLVLVLVEGDSDEGRATLRMVDQADGRTGLTAMMRSTAFPASVVATMLAAGGITARGTLRQELAVPPAPFIDALAERGLVVSEEIKS